MSRRGRAAMRQRQIDSVRKETQKGHPERCAWKNIRNCGRREVGEAAGNLQVVGQMQLAEEEVENNNMKPSGEIYPE